MKIPLDYMKAILITPNKKKKLYACYDGDEKIELYKDKEEQKWIGTIYLYIDIIDYYWSKFSIKPNVKEYKLIIPELDRTWKKFKIIKTNWID